METPACLQKNAFVILRTLRCANVIFLCGSAIAMKLLNEHGLIYDTYSEQHEVLRTSFAATLILMGMALCLILLHLTRFTLNTPRIFWFFLIVGCGIGIFIFFVVDLVYATLCDEEWNCIPLDAMVASSVLKFLSMLVWFVDAIYIRHVNHQSY